MVAMETKDNQIDFNVLYVEGNLKDSNKIKYEFKEFREVVPRPIPLDGKDKIVKLSISFSESIQEKDISYQSFAVALRQSGNADFYFNMARVCAFEQRPQNQIELP